MIRKFCDICGKEVGSEHIELICNFAMFNALNVQEHSDFLEKIDICKECTCKISNEFIEVDLHRNIVRGLKNQLGFLVDKDKDK